MKRFTALFLAALSGLVMCGCQESDSDSSLQSVTLNTHELNLSVGKEQTLTAVVSPGTSEGLMFEWASANPEIASVSENGVVLAVAPGQTVVSVSCQGKRDECRVTVTEAVDKVTVTPSTGEVLIGQTLSLEAKVEPAEIDAPVTWTSTNEDIATVSDDGVVTGVATGTVIVMAEAGGVTGTAMISVVGTPVESVTLNETSIEIDEGETHTLSATVLPASADNKSITWSSSDERIATVSGTGAVYGKRPGEAVITARAGNCTAECRVTVQALPLAVGHFYYSDGSWSATYDSGKTAIGVVFYVGDVTQSDPALAREHPDCTHGLVVALQESTEELAWQSQSEAYGKTIGEWVDANVTDYETPITDFGLEDNLNIPMGYNNTKAIEAFNAAAENSEWPVGVVEFVDNYRETVAAPEASSDWYLGSAKEMSLLATGEYNGNIWDIRDSGASVRNLKTVNESIALIPGAQTIGTAIPVGFMLYWTSTEVIAADDFPSMAISMTTTNGQMPRCYKYESYPIYRTRAILAF